MSRKQIYCGNNRKDPRLNSTHRIGTRYGCLKRGIGVGLNMPVDPSYAGEYEPIQNTKLYCGNKTRVPPGYNGYDTLGGCFRKGVGVGKRQKATSNGFISDDSDSSVGISDDSDSSVGISDDSDPSVGISDDSDPSVGISDDSDSSVGISDNEESSSNKSIGIIFISILGLSIVFLVLYLIARYAKPKWLVKKVNNKTKINWGIFVVIWLSFSLMGILLYHTVTRVK
jgi:hypothetical protein